MRKSVKSIVLFVFSVTILTGSAIGQETVFGPEEEEKPALPEINLEQQELHTFVEMYDEMVELEANYNFKLMDLIQEHGMEIRRYEMLMAAKRLNTDIETEPGEKAKLRAIRKDIEDLKRKTLDSMQLVFQKHQLNQQKYRMILQRMRQDEDFRQRVEKLRQKRIPK
jgi:hypothetical protein